MLLFTFLTTSMRAQDDQGYKEGAWVLSGVMGVNMSQTALSNWSAGGENTFAGNAYLNGKLTHKSGNWLWVSTLVLDYGFSTTKSEGVKKSTDEISFTTSLGYAMNKYWYCTAAADFTTQFAKGYEYPDKSYYISKFFAPAYTNVSLGFEYRPKSNYSVYLAPISAKMTFVEDDYLSDLGSFGVDEGDRFKIEAGAYVKATADMKLMENVNMITTANFFTPYSSQFGNVDVDWDVLISLKVNKYISATINTTLKYDNDVKTYDDDGNKKGAKVQFKEVLGIGIAYNF